MYLTLVFLPLLSSIGAGLFGFFIGNSGAAILTVMCLITTLVLCFVAFFEVILSGGNCHLLFFPWIDSDLFSVSWGFLFDSLTGIMLIVVTFVSCLVHLYSTEYMSHDPHLARFMSYLSLFTFFMLILVTADNFVQMFVGWEGVGLCSYLLINFWFTRIQANKAAIKAMILNRIGDFGLALGIFCIYSSFGAVDYATVFAISPYLAEESHNFLTLNCSLLDLIGILLFIGAVGKSAQLGLHTWLPDAMEGPTPVSALIHAATMVTAGVFLLARCSPLLEYAPLALSVVTLVGAMTAFFAATTGLLQSDMKRVIAYSTCSQLGYMVFACGLSSYNVGVFHLANHAFFKALLFLGAGSVIHALADEQDMRKMGGLSKLLPFTYVMMLIGSLSLMGMPFLTGFYSKDLILELAYGKYSTVGFFAYILGSCGAFLTAFYSMRLLYLTFLSKPNGFRNVHLHAHDAPVRMALPLLILSVPSIFIGYLTRDMFVGLGSDFWRGAIFILPSNYSLVDAEFIPQYIKLFPLILSLSGGCLSLYFYIYAPKILYSLKLTKEGRNLYLFFNRKWFFDKVYNDFVGQSALEKAYNHTYKKIDRGLLEFVGPKGWNLFVNWIGKTLRNLHSGSYYHYTLAMILALVIALGCLALEDWILSKEEIRFLFLLIFSWVW